MANTTTIVIVLKVAATARASTSLTPNIRYASDTTRWNSRKLELPRDMRMNQRWSSSTPASTAAWPA
jgi:hypothetical protein